MALPKGVYRSRNWTEGQDEYLSDNWGRVSDQAVARHLGRTVDACKIRATRHLGLSRTMNIYTSREVARIFGIDSHAVINWIKAGHLKGRKTSVGAGKYRRWDVDDVSIERLIKRSPWLYDRKRIERFNYTIWRNMAEEAWAKTSMLTVAEVAARLGLHRETLRRHIRRGWLKGYKVHWLGNDAGAYLIPTSEVQHFAYRRPVWLALGCAADKNRLRRAS